MTTPNTPASPLCKWRPELEHDDGHITTGPYCDEPATSVSCVPLISTPTCEKHKCRCAKPLPASPPEQEENEERCTDCRRLVKYDSEPEFCAAQLLHADWCDRAACAGATIDLLRSDFAATQARLDALVAERGHLDEAARLCRFTFTRAIESEACTDAEAEEYGERFKSWMDADRAKAGR